LECILSISMSNKSHLKTVFYALIVIFVLIVAFFVIPFPDPLRRLLFPFAGILGLLFLALGITLAIMARKEKGRLKFSLMLTGISAIFPFAGSILHNVFYALAITFESLSFLFEALHVIFFIAALLVAPITFIVGVVGSLILFRLSHN